MIWGIGTVIVSLFFAFNIERIRCKPELLRSGFMVAFTRSPVLMYYRRGETQKQIAQMLAENEHIRKKYIVECYIWCGILFSSGIALIALNW